VPFATTRVNYVWDVPSGLERGGHGHTKIHELCVCPVGSCTVTVEDGTGTKSMTITSPTEGAHIAPGTWITLHDFAPGTVLVIMCSGVYDPDEVIRKRSDFEVRYGAERSTAMPPIPVNTPAFRGDERKFLLDCIDSGWISSEGSYISRFERAMAAYVGRAHATAVANGTAAIDIAMDALGIGPGDEVIMPTFTIISCVSQILRAGAKPVVVDCDASMNMDPTKVEALITPSTKAILAVHIYHFACNMTALLAIAEKHGLPLIEDSAEMIGQSHAGTKCGKFGTISTMSFYPNKHVTTGEGGMVLTDDPVLAEKIAARRNLCFGPPNLVRRFVHHELGWNYRMTNMQAALGCAQLAYIDKTVARKREIGRLYSKLLAGCKGLALPPDELHGELNIYWVYGVVLEESTMLEAEAVTAKLAKRQVGTRPFFWPMHEQPVIHKFGYLMGVKCPVAEGLARRGFYLPSGLALTDEEITHVAKVVCEVMEELL